MGKKHSSALVAAASAPPEDVVFSDTAATTASNTNNLNDELKPHIQTTLYFTFAFVVAWSWDLVAYGISHVTHGMNPLQNQLSFGDHPTPNHIVILLLEYLMVCLGSTIVTDWLVSVYFVL